MGRNSLRGGFMGKRKRIMAGAVATLLFVGAMAPVSRAGQPDSEPKEQVVRYLLATVKAFRTVYVKYVEEHVKKGGIHPKEHWAQDVHAIMLPFQFVKLAAAELKGAVKDVDVGVISLTPIYSSNFPQTEAEVAALKALTDNPSQTVITFADGNQFKGLAADFAIEQACADCHNQHPTSTKRDFKQGDLMGAVVVRLKK
ncbi:MAG: DUF3365 domain-containing protein [Nitrospirae bacterium]|nr:MAG: DUF3365 domain-containing protein [Nitrospirota bacterium]